MSEVVNPDCRESCPLVQECLLNIEQGDRDIAYVRAQHLEKDIKIVGIDAKREDPDFAFKEQVIMDYGDPDMVNAQKSGSKREQAAYDKLQKRHRKFNEAGDKLIEAIMSDQRIQTGLAETAQATCQGKPVSVKRWRFFGREVIQCSSAVGRRWYYDKE